MNQNYTAIIKQDAGWWIGWIEEVSGVNCQEISRDALLASLRETLIEALELNRADALEAAVPRHNEINNQLATKLCRDLGVVEPSKF